MQEVLLRLEGGFEDDALPGEGPPAFPRHSKEPLQREEPRAAGPSIVVAVPLELRLQGFGHAPALGEANLGEQGTRGREPDAPDELLSQEPQPHRIPQERAVTREADGSPVRIQLEELLVIQVVYSHRCSPSFEMDG